MISWAKSGQKGGQKYSGLGFDQFSTSFRRDFHTKWSRKSQKNKNFKNLNFFQHYIFYQVYACIMPMRDSKRTYMIISTQKKNHSDFWFESLRDFESLYIEISIGSGIKIRPKTEIFEISQF